MPNRLAQETSPYLLQHADNPVDWHPWSEDALRLAREQDKPILLSVGYSACHWCHVMAHESFEDASVAAVMNAHFINIKVDREERPDLDQIYQRAHQLLTGRSGGWPLTMFLTPGGVPFFGGTYFPRVSRYNLPGFTDLLQHIAQFYAEHRAELPEQSRRVIAALADDLPPADSRDGLNDVPLAAARQQLLDSFDRVHGGLGRAPKFLHPAEMDFLLRQSRGYGEDEALQQVLFTLQQMAQGGLYDQLGGGFCRYSVDDRWDIPHFEKMLYDNGPLLGLYCHAWQLTEAPLFARVVEQTAAWVMREMQAPSGGYYSSLDADSEHEEGKFYVWQRDEVRELLNADEYAVAAQYFGLDQAPNFENHAWNLRVSRPLEDIAQTLGIAPEQAQARLEGAQGKLYAARERRIRPGRDEKILAAWNGQMIAGMARAARVFNRPDWLRSAQRAMQFVREVLWNDGKLLATCKDGKAHLNAYLDDHAFLLDALLELLQGEYRSCDYEFAVQVADALLARFEDAERGGFYFTSHDHEQLIHRSKVAQDNASPSGNGIAALTLQRLAWLTGELKYAAAAERCLRYFWSALQQAGSYHSSLCTALIEYLQPMRLLILRGSHDEVAQWQQALQRDYQTDVFCLSLPDSLGNLPASLSKPVTGKATAWLCQGAQCLPPIERLDRLRAELRQHQPHAMRGKGT